MEDTKSEQEPFYKGIIYLISPAIAGAWGLAAAYAGAAVEEIPHTSKVEKPK